MTNHARTNRWSILPGILALPVLATGAFPQHGDQEPAPGPLDSGSSPKSGGVPGDTVPVPEPNLCSGPHAPYDPEPLPVRDRVPVLDVPGECPPPPADLGRGRPSTSGGPGARALGPHGTTILTLTGSGVDLAEWDTWWRLNQHEFLRLREHVWRAAPVSGGAEFFLGDGQQAQVVVQLRPTDDHRRDEVAPALKRALAGEGNPDAVAACLLALAKLGEQPAVVGAFTSGDLIKSYLGVSNQQVRETAALALGLLGDPAHLDELASLVAADKDGERLAGGTLNSRTRAFAAYGLGLLAERSERVDVQRFVAHRLVSQIEARERKAQDLAVACLNALSLVSLPAQAEGIESLALTPPSASSQALVAYLLELIEDRRVPESVRAHAPRAIARHVDPFDDPLKERVAGELSTYLAHSRRAGRELQYGSIQALGEIGTAGSRPVDVRIREVLSATFSRGDLNARNLSLIAMAKVAARPHPGSQDPHAGVEPIQRHLVNTLMRGNGRTRPWAALALGVHGHYALAAGVPLSSAASDALRHAFEEERNPTDASALALALGLRADQQASGLLMERLHDFRSADAQGRIATALGMIGAKDAVGPLHELLDSANSRPELLAPVATALALLGDKSLVPDLSTDMVASESSYDRSVRAMALCSTGDSRAIEPAIRVLSDSSSAATLRQMASLALGSMCERDALPWNTAFSFGANYHAAPPSLTAPNGGGVCDIF